MGILATLRYRPSLSMEGFSFTRSADSTQSNSTQANSTEPARGQRRSLTGRVRSIEFSRRAVAGSVSASGYARYVGRVGALAVALGVGSALASSLPVALADTTG